MSATSRFIGKRTTNEPDRKATMADVKNNNLLYDSVASMVADDLAGVNSVDTISETTSYYAGWEASVDNWAKGGNTYILKDAGSAGARPVEDGGHIIHVGTNGLYRQATFLDGVNICQFGADGNGLASAITNCSPMIQATIDYCAFTGRKVRIPKAPRAYVCLDPLVINQGDDPAENAASKYTSTSMTFEGEIYTGGVATTWKGCELRYEGAAGVDFITVNYGVFASEGVKFLNMLVSCELANQAGTVGIKLKQTGVSSVYPRQQRFTRMGVDGFDQGLLIEGDTGLPVLDAKNYYGPIYIQDMHMWKNNHPIVINNCVLNLLNIKDVLIHSSTGVGIDMSISACNLSMQDVHFEGCNEGCIELGVYQADLRLDNVSAEKCGDDTIAGGGAIDATGFFKLPAGLPVMATRVNVSNCLYGFTFMTREYYLGRNCVINSTCPIKVTGFGWTTNTPHMVDVDVPRDKDGVLRIQSSFGSDITGEVRSNSMAGTSVFPTEPTGSTFTEDNTQLQPHQMDMVGTLHVPWSSGTDFIAPSDGFLYVTWMAEYAALTNQNGFRTSSNVGIDSTSPTGFVEGFSFGARSGTHMLVLGVTAGQNVNVIRLTSYDAEWTTLGHVLFSPVALKMGQIQSCAFRLQMAGVTGVAADRPAAAAIGTEFFNQTTGVKNFYDGTGWVDSSGTAA